MDHAINSLEPFYEVTRDQFIEEHRSGEYKKLSENPYYEELKALVDAINILRKYLGWENIKIKDEVSFYLQGGE